MTHKNKTNHISQKEIRDKSKKDIYKKFNDHHFKVTIFGSARIKPEENIYKEIKELAGLIAHKGYDVITGGGPGIMTAAAEGHREAINQCKKGSDVDTIGINIVLPFEQLPNKHLTVLDVHKTFSSRLDMFMLLSNVVVVAPGGIGTTLELFYTWQLMQVGHICKVPIIVYGEMWQTLMAWVDEYIVGEGFAKEQDLDLLVPAHSPRQALQYIEKAHEFFEMQGDNACVNIHQYVAALKQMREDH